MDHQQEISVLNDLLHITNDRKEGFEKVEGKVWEMYPDVKDEYEHMISQSKIMKNELSTSSQKSKVLRRTQRPWQELFTEHGLTLKILLPWET